MIKNTLILSISIFILTPTLYAQSIAPGLWKAKTSFILSGLPLPSSENEECILPEEAKDIKSSITSELKKNGCTLKKWEIKGQNLKASLICKNKEVDAEGTIQGKFSDKSYELNGEAEGTYQSMIPATATVKLTGKWVKACTVPKK
jgi:hypothetical protein